MLATFIHILLFACILLLPVLFIYLIYALYKRSKK